MLNEQIKTFAIKQGFQDVKEIGKYKEYTVYIPIFTDGKSRKTGYPQYILVNNNQISIKIDSDFEITNFFS